MLNPGVSGSKLSVSGWEGTLIWGRKIQTVHPATVVVGLILSSLTVPIPVLILCHKQSIIWFVITSHLHDQVGDKTVKPGVGRVWRQSENWTSCSQAKVLQVSSYLLMSMLVHEHKVCAAIISYLHDQVGDKTVKPGEGRVWKQSENWTSCSQAKVLLVNPSRKLNTRANEVIRSSVVCFKLLPCILT